MVGGPVLSLLADTVLVRIDGQPPGHWDTDSRRVAFVQDDRTQVRAAVSANKIVAVPNDASGRARALARLARYLTRRSVGVALGSGAAWEPAHIGVLEVLERERIPVDVIAGASMGAIVGAHYALGFSPARLTEIATSVQRVLDFVRILPQLLYLAVDFNVARPGMFAGEHFQRILGPARPHQGPDVRRPRDPLPGGRDGHRDRRARQARGRRPQRCDARELLGAVDLLAVPDREARSGRRRHERYVPAETVRSMGADLVIGVNVVPPVYPSAQSPLEAALRLFAPVNPIATRYDTRLPSSFDVVVRILQIMQHELGNDRASEIDVIVNPDLRAFWVLEFWSAAGIISKAGVPPRRRCPPSGRSSTSSARRDNDPHRLDRTAVRVLRARARAGANARGSRAAGHDGGRRRHARAQWHGIARRDRAARQGIRGRALHARNSRATPRPSSIRASASV